MKKHKHMHTRMPANKETFKFNEKGKERSMQIELNN